MGVVPPATPVPPDAAFSVIRGSGEHSGLVCYQHRKMEVIHTAAAAAAAGVGSSSSSQAVTEVGGSSQAEAVPFPYCVTINMAQRLLTSMLPTSTLVLLATYCSHPPTAAAAAAAAAVVAAAACRVCVLCGWRAAPC